MEQPGRDFASEVEKGAVHMDPSQEDVELIAALKRNNGDAEATFLDLAEKGNLNDSTHRARLARLLKKWDDLSAPTLH
ncbi:MAG: hypothetical protein AAB513_01670 [Patescibacteria group bacterium]